MFCMWAGRFGQGHKPSACSNWPGWTAAERTTVSLGRSSVSTIEIVNGLREGDQVVISDTTTMDNYKTIRVR